MGKLGEAFSKTNGMKGKMVTVVNEVGWSLQRFCQIVDNNGNPLSFYQRSMNRGRALVIPEPQAKPPFSEMSNSWISVKNNDDWKNSKSETKTCDEKKEESRIETAPIEPTESKDAHSQVDPKANINLQNEKAEGMQFIEIKTTSLSSSG